jgi:hypothetical protein
MDKKFNREVDSLVKLGLPENIAIITASVKLGKPEIAEIQIEEIKEEQNELKEMLSLMMPMEEAQKLQQEGSKCISVNKPEILEIEDKKE